MPRPSRAVAQYRSQVANCSRRHGADSPQLIPVKQQLKAELLAEKIQAAVDSFPPLTEDQILRLSGLLRSTDGQAAA